MAGATWSNFRSGQLDFRLGLPIIAASVITAPIGGWLSHFLSPQTVLIGFTIFLFFSGTMIIFFQGIKNKSQNRETCPSYYTITIGTLAGLISGLLGVGGGGLISPLMFLLGFNPKKVAVITAFAVPFASFSAFLTYASMGTVPWSLLFYAGTAAWAGGWLGTVFMQKRLDSGTVRKILGTTLLLLGFKLILNI